MDLRIRNDTYSPRKMTMGERTSKAKEERRGAETFTSHQGSKVRCACGGGKGYFLSWVKLNYKEEKEWETTNLSA